jgi:RES domain-containing protein
VLSQEEQNIQRWLKKVARFNLKGRTFWRCIERTFATTALESGPNFLQPSRYSISEEFSALYLSESQALARLEKTQGYEEDFEPLADLRFRFTAKAEVPDLSDQKTQASLLGTLGIDPRDLTVPGIDGYRRTHLIARAAFHSGLVGFLAPSVHPVRGSDPGWRNLVVYPANVVQGLLDRQ